eukprot:227627_1
MDATSEILNEIIEEDIQLKRKVICHCIFWQLSVSLCFFCWSMINIFVRDQGFDVGAVSFPIPFIGGVLGLLAVYNYTKHKNLLMILHILFIACGNTVLLIEYVMGAFDFWGSDESNGYIIYCIVFSVVYFVVLIITTYWSVKWRNSVLENQLQNIYFEA